MLVSHREEDTGVVLAAINIANIIQVDIDLVAGRTRQSFPHLQSPVSGRALAGGDIIVTLKPETAW
jgi:hypothetical protein